ncbi:MAG TPA: tetratricopeptide repeat protein [Bacteroidetes bacterium]|nr:tetratricopeptide repeat protein [Bacteroidota bacterium]
MKIKNYQILLTCLLFAGLSACNGDAPSSEAPADTQTPGLLVTGNPAIDGLTKKIAEAPNDASLYAARAGAWYENENYDEGIADLEKAIALDSSKAEYYHVLSDMYFDYYKSRLGLNVMVKAAEKFPKRIPTLLKLAECQLILQLHKDALFTLERIRTIDPQNSEMFFMFGSVFKDMGRKDEAINAYQSAVENDPELTDAWINLANLLADKGSPLAGKYFDNALRIDSNNIIALHSKAHYLSNKKDDLEGAIKLYKKINTIDPQYMDGYYNTGLLYLDMDSLQRAYQSFDIAVKYAPQFPDAYYHRGVAAELMGNKAQAISDYKNVLNLDPDYASAKAGLKRLEK